MGRLNLALVERSKVFGGALKRKTKRVRLSDSEKAEETKSSGRKTTLYDPQSFFDQVQLTKERDTRKKIQRKSAGTGLDFEEVNIRVSVPSPDRGRREGKAPMIEEEETQASKKTKEQILQEEAGLAEAISLGDDASKQGRIDIGDINTDAEITLIDETQGRINDIIADEDITLIPKLIIKLLKM
ncbi:hypothetical protein Tco_0707479 [Tanacetum coccineum]|uniref:Uncharacterized protein n=1 Tax=Tanacetum coccineum TaxID=301880 RepID=A0ABQ4YAE3_9ASTR